MQTAGQSLYPTRTVAELQRDRARAVKAWREAATHREQLEQARRENREAGTEARRRLEALRRIDAALAKRSELAGGGKRDPSQQLAPRAVIVHRLEWMRERLTAGLSDHGIAVVATEHDGADGLGVSIAEQPDLLVVEDRLPSVRAVEVVSELRQFAPRTVIAAQVEQRDDAIPMIEAGAGAVFTRRVPPADISAQLAGFLRERPEVPLIVA